jgi:hypothetical protein
MRAIFDDFDQNQDKNRDVLESPNVMIFFRNLNPLIVWRKYLKKIITPTLNRAKHVLPRYVGRKKE